MNETVKKPSIMEFSSITDKHQNTYGGHDLEKAVNEKMKDNTKSLSRRGERSKIKSPYIEETQTTLKNKYTPQQLMPLNQEIPHINKAVSSTMIGRFSEPISKPKKRKSTRPRMVVKNGKLLISSKKK